MALAVWSWLGSLAAASVLFGSATRAEASSFDRWLRNPYPVADGFSFPVGDGEGGGAYTDPAGRRHDGWYVATHLGDVFAAGFSRQLKDHQAARPGDSEELSDIDGRHVGRDVLQDQTGVHEVERPALETTKVRIAVDDELTAETWGLMTTRGFDHRQCDVDADGALETPLTLTPTLCSMLRDPLLQARYRRYLSGLLELAEKELHRTHWDASLLPLAELYLERWTIESAFQELEQALRSEIDTLGYPGSIIRLNPGPNPAETALAEYYELPVNEAGEPVEGFSPRGMDIDREGVAWVALASGHLASFDRRKVKGPLNGPKATGQHAREGWTFYTEPLPQLYGLTTPGSAEASYYTWVDQFNTLGLGRNVPINTGNESEGLLVLKDGQWVILRVPYPVGFYTKWMDGRIDNPDVGWKGRGLWACISTRAPFHMEGGKGTTSKVMKFQLRPDPLAR
jgi:hypothetical protein